VKLRPGGRETVCRNTDFFCIIAHVVCIKNTIFQGPFFDEIWGAIEIGYVWQNVYQDLSITLTRNSKSSFTLVAEIYASYSP
jgi:hypothetical protein